LNILYVAAIFIIFIGLKFLSPFLIYLILSLFLTILVYPAVAFFEKRGFPIIVGYLVVSLMVVGIFFVMFLILTTSLREFLDNVGFYQQRLLGLINSADDLLKKYEISLNLSALFSGIVPFIKLFLKKAGSILSGFLVIFIGVSFLIFETKNFGKKLNLLVKNKKPLEEFFKNTQKYFLIKTFTSALTGVSVTIMLLFFDIPYAYLFGIIAFIFNFIPVIGSIIAAIPAIIIALITYDLQTAIYVTIGYVVINNVISNVLEPKIMGDGLDLSPAVVFFSLLVWGWVFGIVGMFLAAPLTMTLKLALQSSEKTKNIALLLSNKIRSDNG